MGLLPACASWTWPARTGQRWRQPRPKSAVVRRTSAGRSARRERTVVAHPCHEFPRIRARIGGELVTGMSQVVNVDLRQPDRSERREPDPTPEVGVGKRPSPGLVNASGATSGSAARCVRRSGTIRLAKTTTRRPARDFGGPNTGTVPGLLSWRLTRTVQASRSMSSGRSAASSLQRRLRKGGQEDQRPIPEPYRIGQGVDLRDRQDGALWGVLRTRALDPARIALD